MAELTNINEHEVRRNKLAYIRETENFAFPNDFRRSHYAVELHNKYDQTTKFELEMLKVNVAVTGRIMTKRFMGKIAFITLKDGDGSIQLYISQDIVSNAEFEKFKKWDIGDIVGVEGAVFKTNTDELSINTKKARLLTKALRPLPDKFHGLSDQEMRYRQRYVDLIVNEKSYNTFKLRSKILAEIRNYMVSNGFMEVETPMMQVIPGGASARPFITHHNALNSDLYLRISPELFLKRLIVGGFDRVFEINRNFRNEGISPRHNPEFTMMELYMAHADYRDLIKLTENLFRTVAINTLGSPIVKYGNIEFDFSKPFVQMTMREAIIHYGNDIQLDDIMSYESAVKIAQKLGIQVEKSWGLGRLQSEIFEEVAEKHLIQPTFITEYPAEISPLARRNDIDPEYTDRFEFFIGAREIGNGFSELNDAEDQAERFRDQVKAKEAGDDEAMFYDDDYVIALEYGMPPTAGLGIGIDRMVMLLTDSHTIRDVILFPTLKPTE
ncbi:lysine--tRNA ligase [Histophilus somni]|uniref:lysine--tRNA ligase n=1 Tax=Histophilus somni TaxID=731 RepID=UPI00201F945D|nr:lysine--tRNA ligase [Histophilus somni]